MTKERIAIIDGARSPFAKSWTTLNGLIQSSCQLWLLESCCIE